MNDTQYDKATETAVFQGKPVMLTHLTPVLTPEQRDKRKREIENQLFDVFSKYKTGREK